MEPARLEGIPLFADLDDEQRRADRRIRRERRSMLALTLARAPPERSAPRGSEEGVRRLSREMIGAPAGRRRLGEIGLLMTGTRMASGGSPRRRCASSPCSRGFKRRSRAR